ncbi:hypothetical protein M8J77_015718 [Diaphorina citri]|nr:hypothetical protein M8J77_015718 [Diaphorina citri]
MGYVQSSDTSDYNTADEEEEPVQRRNKSSVGTTRTLLNNLPTTSTNISNNLDDESSGASSQSSTPKTTRTNVTRIFRRSLGASIGESPGSPLTQSSQATTISRHSGRMRWDRNLNMKLLDAYYISTELDANRKQYMRRLEMLWNSDPTNPNIDGNKLATRVRYILKRKLYSEPEIEAIKRNVRSKLTIAPTSTTSPITQHSMNHDDELQHVNDSSSILNTNTNNEPHITDSLVSINIESDLYNSINNKFQEFRNEYETMPPDQRPMIPKIHTIPNVTIW